MSLHRMFPTVAIAMVAAAAPAVSGCGSSHTSSSSSSESVGTIHADLVAVGPNGVQYDLPANAVFLLTPAGVGEDAAVAETNELFFQSGVMEQDFSVPPGQYTGQLVGGPPWALQNVTAGGTTNAVLLDTQPYAITVGAGKTTALSFHFELAGVGNVTFGTGTLATTLSVVGGDGGMPTNGNFSASLAMDQSQPQAVNGKGNPGISNLINGGTPATFQIPQSPFQITGPFEAEVDSACATITAPKTPAIPNTTGSGGTGAVDLFSEAAGQGSTGVLCIYDANGPTTNTLLIQFERTGTAQTATVSAVLGSSLSATFVSTIVGSASSLLYSGTAATGMTADLTGLATTTTMPVVQTSIDFDPGQPDETIAVSANETQSLTVQLQP